METGSKPSEAESSDDEQPSDDAFNVATPKPNLMMESIPNSPASLSQWFVLIFTPSAYSVDGVMPLAFMFVHA